MNIVNKIIHYIFAQIDWDSLFLFHMKSHDFYKSVFFILTSHILTYYFLNEIFIFSIIFDIISIIILKNLKMNFIGFLTMRTAYYTTASSLGIASYSFFKNGIIAFISTLLIREFLKKSNNE